MPQAIMDRPLADGDLAWAKVLGRCSVDEGYRAQLLDSPRDLLEQAGLCLPADRKVEVRTDPLLGDWEVTRTEEDKTIRFTVSIPDCTMKASVEVSMCDEGVLCWCCCII